MLSPSPQLPRVAVWISIAIIAIMLAYCVPHSAVPMGIR